MDRRGRLLIRKEQREALLDAFKSSGLSAMAFCQLHDLKYSTFATWRKKKRSFSHAVSQPSFAEVVVESSAASLPASNSNLIRITLPSGTVIEGFNREQIPVVVELIRSLSNTRPC